jgi:hypothetical protein
MRLQRAYNEAAHDDPPRVAKANCDHANRTPASPVWGREIRARLGAALRAIYPTSVIPVLERAKETNNQQRADLPFVSGLWR